MNIAALLALAAELVQDVPQVLAIVKEGIAAYESGDQAALDKANADARALADARRPPDAQVSQA